MKHKMIDRREFIKGLGVVGVGGSLFSLCIPKGSWAVSVADKDYERTTPIMGTLVSVTIIGEGEVKSREAVLDVFREMREIEDLMSTHRQFTPLSRVNKVAGSEMMEVEPRILDVARASLRWGRQTEGLFDVTTLPLIKYWGFRDQDATTPASLEKALEPVNYKQIKIEGNRVGLEKKGAGMDFGGIAKGYAVDRGISLLREKWGITNAIVVAGGDLYVLGKPVDAPGWKIGLKNPVGPGLVGTFYLADQAVSTSGNYERKRYQNGKEIGHELNPFTGEPVDAFLSCSAVAKTSMEADAASTTLFVAGRSAKHDLIGPDISALNIDRAGDGSLRFNTQKNFPKIERI